MFRDLRVLGMALIDGSNRLLINEETNTEERRVRRSEASWHGRVAVVHQLMTDDVGGPLRPVHEPLPIADDGRL